MKAILDTNQNQLPRLEKAERIAKAIGLEFYIGLLRHDGLHLHDGSIRHDGQPPGQGAAVLIDLAPPARGRHWMVPETDPPDAFFFKPLSDFADAAGLPYLAADQWGYAEAVSDPASLRPTQQIVVRRARPGPEYRRGQPCRPRWHTACTYDRRCRITRFRARGDTRSLAGHLARRHATIVCACGAGSTVDRDTLRLAREKLVALQARAEQLSEDTGQALDGLNALLPDD